MVLKAHRRGHQYAHQLTSVHLSVHISMPSAAAIRDERRSIRPIPYPLYTLKHLPSPPRQLFRDGLVPQAVYESEVRRLLQQQLR